MTAIFKREFRSFFHGMLGYVLTAFLVASSGLYFLARCLIYGLTDFSYYTLYHFHAAALYPGAGDALTGRGTPQPHRPAAAHQPGLSVGHRAGQVLCHGGRVRTALRRGCGDDLHPLGAGRHRVCSTRKPCGAALLLFAGLCGRCIV